MNKTIIVSVLFSVSLALGQTNTGFTFVPQNGQVLAYYNGVDLPKLSMLKDIYKPLSDPTCWKIYKRSRIKNAFGWALDISGSVILGLAIGSALSPDASTFKLNSNITSILALSGAATFITGIFFFNSAAKDVIRSMEYYNKNLSINISATGILGIIRF